MKKIRLLLLTLLCITNLHLFAQDQPDQSKDKGDRKEKVEAMKIAFLTKRLNLNADEAKRFWPVYNQYSDERDKLREERLSKKRGMPEKIESMSDADAEKIVDGEIAYRQRELDLLKKYHIQFKQILPVKKVALLYGSEEDFKRELLEQIKEKRQDRK